MVVPDLLSIVFDNSTGEYLPRQLVTGHVDLHLRKAMNTIGICLEVYGGAWTSLTKERTFISDEKIYTSNEVYIDLILVLWGNGSSQVMPIGRYNFPFAFILPDSCLPSIQGTKGAIEYYCKVKIERAWRPDYKVKEYFTVLPYYDLNLNSSLIDGKSQKCSRSLGFCCCPNGTVSLQIKIPKSGFVEGETFLATCRMNNQSSQRMASMEIGVLQFIDYKRAPEEGREQCTKTKKSYIWKTRRNLRKMLAPADYGITSEITLPRALATTGNSTSIIQIHYELVCKLVPKGFCEINLKRTLEITIGTIPLRPSPSAILSQTTASFSPDEGRPLNLNSDQDSSVNLIPDEIPPETPPPDYSAALASLSIELHDEQPLLSNQEPNE